MPSEHAQPAKQIQKGAGFSHVLSQAQLLGTNDPGQLMEGTTTAGGLGFMIGGVVVLTVVGVVLNVAGLGLTVAGIGAIPIGANPGSGGGTPTATEIKIRFIKSETIAQICQQMDTN